MVGRSKGDADGALHRMQMLSQKGGAVTWKRFSASRRYGWRPGHGRTVESASKVYECQARRMSKFSKPALEREIPYDDVHA